MTNYQQAILSGYERMLAECNKSAASVAMIPLFKQKVDQVAVIVAEIKELVPLQKENNKGITTQKNNLYDDLVDLELDIAGAIHAYAVEVKDVQLQEKSNLKTSVVSRVVQNALILHGEQIQKLLKLIPAESFEELGLSNRELDEFNTKLAGFKSIVNDKSIVTIDQSAVSLRIRDCFAQLSEIKSSSLNRLVRQFKRKDPEFYFKYKAAMVVRYNSGKKTSDTVETESDATAKV